MDPHEPHDRGASHDASAVDAQARYAFVISQPRRLGLILFLCHPLLPHGAVRKLDRFAREHLLANHEPVRNEETLLGGAATVLLIVAIVTTAAFYLSQPNVITSKGVVPAQDGRHPLPGRAAVGAQVGPTRARAVARHDAGATTS